MKHLLFANLLVSSSVALALVLTQSITLGIGMALAFSALPFSYKIARGETLRRRVRAYFFMGNGMSFALIGASLATFPPNAVFFLAVPAVCLFAGNHMRRRGYQQPLWVLSCCAFPGLGVLFGGAFLLSGLGRYDEWLPEPV